ncbi:MAG: hypothetical protein ACYCOU_02430 [Sulfobacillus sp.]
MLEVFLSIVVIAIVLLLWYQQRNSPIEYVKSQVDGREYLVKSLPDKQEAADRLASLRQALGTFCRRAVQRHPENSAVRRMHRNFIANNENLSENTGHSGTSYSVNKGQEIVLCLRQKNSQLAKENTMVFVALHEMAHLMSESIGHTPEFWDNFRFVLREAMDQGIYQYQDYGKTPEEYCGLTISNTPLPDGSHKNVDT